MDKGHTIQNNGPWSWAHLCGPSTLATFWTTSEDHPSFLHGLHVTIQHCALVHLSQMDEIFKQSFYTFLEWFTVPAMFCHSREIMSTMVSPSMGNCSTTPCYRHPPPPPLPSPQIIFSNSFLHSFKSFF